MMLIKLAELSQLDPAFLERSLGVATGRGTPPLRSAAPVRPVPRQQALSPLRTGLGLLLHSPRLATLAGTARRWVGLNQPGIRLFIDLIELLQEQPHLHGGVVLERWRGAPEEALLIELAKWDPPLPAEGLEAEFGGVVQWLDNRLAERRREELQTKWQQAGLSPAERAELVDLQRRRGGASSDLTPH